MPRYQFWEQESPIGTLSFLSSGKGLKRLGISVTEGASLRAEARGLGAIEAADDPIAAQLCEYFAGHRQVFDLALDLAAMGDFQRTVLLALAEVPFGMTSTYGALARRIGRPQAARAVGGALGRNPLPIVLPCHRVLGQNGGLTGFSSGLSIKRALLHLEGVLQDPGDGLVVGAAASGMSIGSAGG